MYDPYGLQITSANTTSLDLLLLSGSCYRTMQLCVILRADCHTSIFNSQMHYTSKEARVQREANH